ncbi:unnamed protein product [Pedinophyceae sp. YPF-701]|nr:unnamed protein product [Pedinophyceae sp. YPF-701]
MPPSRAPSRTELAALQAFTTVLCDEVPLTRQTNAAAVTPSILMAVVENPTAPGHFKSAVTQSLATPNKAPGYEKIDPELARADRGMVALAGVLLNNVDGKISADVNCVQCDNEDDIVEHALLLASLFEQHGIPKSKLIFRIPGTWAGIQAAGKLERSHDLTTCIVFVHTFAQARAAAQAGVSLVQVNKGRISSWFKQNPGVIRDPSGPREDSGAVHGALPAGLVREDDPGLRTVAKIYNYLARAAPRTQLIVSGIRKKADVFAIAGVPYVVCPDRVLRELRGAATVDGYNDGLHGGDAAPGVKRVLSPEGAKAVRFRDAEMVPFSEKEFDAELKKSVVGAQLLRECMQRREMNLAQLRPLMSGLVVGSE